ncbi:MAG: hypothetical protein KBA30_08765 [Clostridia bacterium]|nr:hypothetical protein [Clostridia bacterium]
MVKVFKSSAIQLDPCRPVRLELPGVVGQIDRVAAEDAEADECLLSDQVVLELMERARDNASTLLEQAAVEAGELRSQAVQDGYREGMKRAEAEMETLRREAAARMDSEKAALRERFEQEMSELEPEVLEVALAVAEKILHTELARSEKAYSGLVRHALSRLVNGERGTIRVGRDDFFRSVQSDTELMEAVQDRFEFAVDDAMPAGGCVIESTSGTVDAGVETQLENIVKAMRGTDE